MAAHIDESNWGEFAAAVLEAEASHWVAEYENMTRRYGSTGAKKVRAAWRLGASILRRRAQEYRGQNVRLTRTPGEQLLWEIFEERAVTPTENGENN